jgi:hypothetical protein
LAGTFGDIEMLQGYQVEVGDYLLDPDGNLIKVESIASSRGTGRRIKIKGEWTYLEDLAFLPVKKNQKKSFFVTLSS